MIRRLAVVGVGLMGGSLGLALRDRGGWRVAGLTRREETVRRARLRGAIDEGSTDPARVLPGAEVVVLCSPVHQILPLARRLRRFIDPGSLVMDVGSVKGPVVHGAQQIFTDPRGPVFVGAHPMTGSEKTGVENARADLYQGAVCALTPARHTHARDRRRAVGFWKTVGARPLFLEPDVHDQAVALISHLPHVIADALVLAAARWRGRGKNPDLLRTLAAGSFRDATRVAGADPRLWQGIFQMNDTAVRKAIALFIQELTRLQRAGWPLARLSQAQMQKQTFGPLPPTPTRVPGRGSMRSGDPL